MKRIYFSISLLLFALSLAAQPTFFYTQISTANNTIPFGSTSSNLRQMIYYPSDFPGMPSGVITTLYVKASSVVSPNYTQLDIKMGPTSLSTFTAGPWETGLTTVFSGPIAPTQVSGNWIVIPLQNPYLYNNTQNLIVEASHGGYTTGFTAAYESNTIATNRSLYGNSANTTGNVQARIAVIGFDMVVGSFCLNPGNLTVSNVGTISADFSWNPDTNAVGFEYELSTSSTPPTGSGTPITANTYSDNSLSPGTTYYFHARTDCGSSTGYSSWSTVSFTTCPAATVSSPGSMTVCDGQTVMLLTDSNSLFNYQWSYNGTPIGGAGLYWLETTYPGNYTVEISYGACTSNSQPVTVTTIPLPPSSISPSITDTVCPGLTLLLSGNTGTGLSHQWLFNGVAIPGETNPSFTASTPGNYALEVFDGTCTNTDDFILVNYNPPTPGILQLNGINLSTGNFITYQWNLNGAPIPNATSQNYTATANGNYTVTVTDSRGCTGTSAAKQVNNVGISESDVERIQVYPNPARDLIYFSGIVSAQVQVYNLEGKQVMDLQSDGIIESEALAEGLYLLHIRNLDGELLHIQKITISK